MPNEKEEQVGDDELECLRLPCGHLIPIPPRVGALNYLCKCDRRWYVNFRRGTWRAQEDVT